MGGKRKREVIFEFKDFGNIIQLNAIDVDTKVEVSIQGASYVNEEMMKKTALAKLNYVLAQKVGKKQKK